MCTLSFAPTADGYLAGMNRDELFTRPAALPPKVCERDGTKLVYPRESSGGTWIAANSRGNLLALLNWNEINAASLGEKRRTRGLVIPHLILEENASSTDTRLDRLSLDGVFPFRLIGAFRNERQLMEWRWDGTGIQQLGWAWARKHWFSSSLSDTAATAERSRVCDAAALDPAVGSAHWLRQLHRSHEPKPGPYSVCVHRPDAATVSYTEVECCRSSISMRYLSGSPCLKDHFDELASAGLSDSQAARRFA